MQDGRVPPKKDKTPKIVCRSSGVCQPLSVHLGKPRPMRFSSKNAGHTKSSDFCRTSASLRWLCRAPLRTIHPRKRPSQNFSPTGHLSPCWKNPRGGGVWRGTTARLEALCEKTIPKFRDASGHRTAQMEATADSWVCPSSRLFFVVCLPRLGLRPRLFRHPTRAARAGSPLFPCPEEESRRQHGAKRSCPVRDTNSKGIHLRRLGRHGSRPAHKGIHPSYLEEDFILYFSTTN
jgi:hypothetical protein